MKSAIRLFCVFVVMLGFLYPFTILLFGEIFVPYQTNGSLIKVNDKIVASELIAQEFRSDKYFYNRIDNNSDPMPQLSKELFSYVTSKTKKYDSLKEVPLELVTHSASNLDPYIKPYAALVQIDRISAVRSISKDNLIDIINNNIEKPVFKFLGSPKVSVLKLNLELDKIK